MQRSLVPITTHDTGFIQYMDSGIWHLAIYNDGKETETVSFLTTAIGEHSGHNLVLKPVIAIHIIHIIPASSTAAANSPDLGHESQTVFGRFQQPRKVQVNQGEVEYYKNQDISAILPCP